MLHCQWRSTVIKDAATVAAGMLQVLQFQLLRATEIALQLIWVRHEAVVSAIRTVRLPWNKLRKSGIGCIESPLVWHG